MSDELNELLLQWLEGGSAFIMEQAPGLAQEIIFAGRVWTALGLLPLTAWGLGTIVLIFKTGDRLSGDISGFWLCFIGPCSVIWTMLVLAVHANAWIAPKLYVLKCLTRLL